MKLLLLLFAIFIARTNSFEIPSCDPAVDTGCINNENEARKYVDSLNKTITEERYKLELAKWRYQTDVTEEHKESFKTLETAFKNLLKQVSAKLRTYAWKNFQDNDLVQLATAYFVLGDETPNDILEKKTRLSEKLKTGFDSAKVCKFTSAGKDSDCKKELKLGDINKIMKSSRNYDELSYYWTQWREATGYQKDDYIEFIKIDNSSAKYNGFENLKDKWSYPYGNPELSSVMRRIYSERFQIEKGVELSLEDLYIELHKYVKGKLMEEYNQLEGVNITKDGLIPEHLLGNVYGKTWENFVNPFEFKTDSVFKPLSELFTPIGIVNTTAALLVSMGYDPMTEKFWKHSLIEKPDDGRKVECPTYAVAWDLMGKDDYRILSCMELTYGHFFFINQRMQGIAYAMQYRNKPYPYRAPANPGVKFSIEGSLFLAVNTPSHFRQIGALTSGGNLPNDLELDDGTRYGQDLLYFLMNKALHDMPFLADTLTLETWRSNFFSGHTHKDNLNQEYLRLRQDIQGLEAPVVRSGKILDPLARKNVRYHSSDIERFFGYLGQQQFREALCKISGQYDPNNADVKTLHECDFTVGGEKTTRLLREMMEKGSSPDWKDAMKKLIGTTEISGESMLKFLMPLYRYLKQENDKNGMESWK